MQKFANNAWGKLASSITSTDTIINLTPGHGARFPTLAAGDYFDATLIDASKNLERIRVTARANDQLTVIRGQDGTTARAYSAGDLLELRWGNSDAESLRQESVRAVSLSGTDTYTGTLSPAPTAYNTDQVYWLKFANTNTVTNPTVNLNSLGAKTLKYADGSAIPAGGLPTGVAVPFVYNGTDFLALDYPVQYGRTLVNPANKSQTLTFGVTTNWDASLGQVAVLTLTGNTTLAAPTNLKAGGHYTLRVVQDATGGRTITWNAAYKGVRGAAMPQPASAANTTTVYHFVSDGTSLFLVSLSDVLSGKQTIWIPAAAMTPRVTGGATGPSQVELATNKINYKCLDFADGASALHAQFMMAMPKSWDLGTISARFHWTFSSGSGGNVVWQVRAVAVRNGVSLDTAMGTAQAVTQAVGTANALHITSDTPAVTVGGSPQVRDLVMFEFFRDPAHASDTSTVTARLLGVEIIYNSNAADDS